jgi:lysozyme
MKPTDLSPAGAAFIKRWESGKGARLDAYLDDVGIPTIGWGSTRGVKLGMKITEKEADDRFRGDVAEALLAVNTLVKVQLTQGQFDALVSWTFALGFTRLRDSTLLLKLNAGDPAAAAEIPRWCKERIVDRKGGETVVLVKGLLDRRIEELAMFLTG